MNTRKDLQTRFEQCAKTVFERSSNAGVARDEQTLATLAFSVVAPMILKNASFERWLGLPGVDSVDGDFNAEKGDEGAVAVEFLIDKGIFCQTQKKAQFALAEKVNKNDLVFSTLAAHGWLREFTKEIEHDVGQISEGRIDTNAIDRLGDLRVQAAAFLGGLSYYNSIDGILDSMQSVYENLMNRDSHHEMDQHLLSNVLEGARAIKGALDEKTEELDRLKSMDVGQSEIQSLSRRIAFERCYAGHGDEAVEKALTKAYDTIEQINQALLDSPGPKACGPH